MSARERQPRWTVEFYLDIHGESPVEDAINALPNVDQVAIDHHLDLLEEFGLDAPGVKQVEGKIFELRPRSNRLLYFAHTGRRFIVLHWFRKKTNKTPRKEIAMAKGRMRDFLERME